MINMYNQYNLEATTFDYLTSIFKKYLVAEKISSGSTRSYLSDVRHFLGWLSFFLQSNHIDSKLKDFRGSLEEVRRKGELEDFRGEVKEIRGKLEDDKEILEVIGILKHVNERVLKDYKTYLTSNNVPLKTINRRFSSLRRFGEFCKDQNWIPSAPLRMSPFDTLRNISLNQPFPESEYHLGEFRTELWRKGLTKISLKNYLSDVKQFLAWTGKNFKGQLKDC